MNSIRCGKPHIYIPASSKRDQEVSLELISPNCSSLLVLNGKWRFFDTKRSRSRRPIKLQSGKRSGR
jgi:hypothetical protein